MLEFTRNTDQEDFNLSLLFSACTWSVYLYVYACMHVTMLVTCTHGDMCPSWGKTRLNHQNIVEVAGVCMMNEPFLCVLEFMPYGDLKKGNSNIFSQTCVSLCKVS